MVVPGVPAAQEATQHVLQLGGSADVPPWVGAVIQYGDLASAALGIFIAYQAFRGYRRNDSRPMLFISLGFVLALGVPFALLLVSLVLGPASVWVIGLATQVAELAGLASILYALWMPA